ncbi:hypothetical protein AB9P05_06485 [Roseivirga sp. BDSF3-8]
MNLPFTLNCLEVLDLSGMEKVRGGLAYEEDGQPIGETKGDPPPLI